LWNQKSFQVKKAEAYRALPRRRGEIALALRSIALVLRFLFELQPWFSVNLRSTLGGNRKAAPVSKNRNVANSNLQRENLKDYHAARIHVRLAIATGARGISSNILNAQSKYQTHNSYKSNFTA
jgi:hypothetical protein